MENASKALIMAGGMLLAILIISLLVYAWSLFSKYQSSKDSLSDIEDTAKFNEQFSNYDRDDVQGYELISLVNKIIDYNYRKSNDAEAKSNDKYSPIKITIDFRSDDNMKKLSYNSNNTLFTSSNFKYTQSQDGQTTKNPLESIIKTATDLENDWGGSDNATKIAKGIKAIFLENTPTPPSENQKIDAVKKWNYSSSKKYPLTLEGYNKMNSDQKANAYKYYEYVQFKKAVFKSDSSSLKYDNVTGRITEMVFNFDKIR